MQLKEFTADDYETCAQWWSGHGWEPVPAVVLPKLGMMVVDDEAPICAAWLYMDNSVGVSMLEWLVTNPDVSPMQTARAIKTLVAFMSDRAKEMNYGVMLTTCRQPSLARMYEKSGFIKTDEGVTHLLKMVKKEEQ